MVEKINNLHPFYVGQKVVCIDDTFPNNGHYNAPLVKGKEYVVNGLFKGCCYWYVDVGLHSVATHALCSSCNNLFLKPATNSWLRHNRFAPIVENFQSITLEKVLEEQTPLVSAN